MAKLFNLKSFVLISENFEFVFEIVDVRLRADAILNPVQHRVGRRLAQDVRRRQRRRWRQAAREIRRF